MVKVNGTKKCQRKAKVYGLFGDNKDENDCTRSSIGCAWVNNTYALLLINVIYYPHLLVKIW